jgi:cytidylate kinase
MIIAVDGPAGSGKSTVSKKIADEIGFTYLDTGAMYRLFAYKLMKDNIDISDREKELEVLANLNIDMKDNRFYLDDEDVTDKIRTREISSNASKISVVKEVREKMVDLQRAFSKSKNVILDGRDIGTVVFPDADLKIYLNADPKIRAERRCMELRNKGENVEYEEILKEITTRDYDDMHRKESPLKIAEDAVILDSTSLTAEEVKEKIKELIIKKAKKT